LMYVLKPVPFILKPVPFKLTHHRFSAVGGIRGIMIRSGNVGDSGA
jgi:hypothetical protein